MTDGGDGVSIAGTVPTPRSTSQWANRPPRVTLDSGAFMGYSNSRRPFHHPFIFLSIIFLFSLATIG
ncbi:hypothetical protein EBZ35_06230 [bacterium]|nr:hypothetical protein [bacterium]